MWRYFKHKFKHDISQAYIGFFYWFSLLAFVFYYFFPFKLFGLMGVASITLLAIYILFKECTAIFLVHYLNMSLTACALYFNWQWGFTFFGFHLERYYLWLMLGASVLAYLAKQCVALFQKGRQYVTRNQ